MLSIETLREYGANVDEALVRCFGKEDFYLKLVNMILDEPSFELLEKALTENNLDAAFEAAHGLKGVVSNLSLTPLQGPIVEITELLRARTQMNYDELLEKINKEKEKLFKLIKE